jgi:hypothetical protein
MSKNTPDNENNNGDNAYLDRHDVKCDDDSFLSYFRLVTSPGSKMRYDYRCSKTDKPLTCRSLSTSPNEKGDTYYLDRHNLKCEDDEALQRFKLTRPDGKIAYDYTCCKFKSAPASKNTSCYGAKDGVCNTCDDVINAYKARKWAFKRSDFEQCN